MDRVERANRKTMVLKEIRREDVVLDDDGRSRSISAVCAECKHAC